LGDALLRLQSWQLLVTSSWSPVTTCQKYNTPSPLRTKSTASELKLARLVTALHVRLCHRILQYMHIRINITSTNPNLGSCPSFAFQHCNNEHKRIEWNSVMQCIYFRPKQIGSSTCIQLILYIRLYSADSRGTAGIKATQSECLENF
jgi:hypothetical protein